MAEGELLQAICSEEEQAEVQKWCKDNDCTISHMFETRLEKSDEMREKGNELLKEGNFEEAQMRYYAAVFQVDFSMAQYGEGAKKYEDQLNSRKMRILSNLAVARLQHRKLTECKAVADLALRLLEVAKLDEESTKADQAKLWYLKGKANMERGFSEDAVEAFKKAQEAAPDDAKIKASLKQAVGQKKEDQVSAKKVWNNKLLTSDQAAALGPWWQPQVQMARLRERIRLRGGCCGRRKQKDDETKQDSENFASSRPSYSSYSSYSRSRHYHPSSARSRFG